MGSVKSVLLAGAAAIFCNAAIAADLPMPPMFHPSPSEDFSSWYLRGDIGMTNQRVKRLDNVLYSTANSVVPIGMGFDSSPLFGLGVGYQFNNWLRFDVTGEYRGAASFHGLDIVNGNSTDEYRARKSEWVALVNAYADLGTWWNVTPFVGAGIGATYNRISGFLDVNTPANGVAFGADTGKWQLAWALYGGLGFKVTNALTLELAYRYINLGDAQSGDLITFNGVNNVNNPMHFRDITSHDLKLGLRWLLDPEPAAPKPMFVPPPLRSRG